MASGGTSSSSGAGSSTPASSSASSSSSALATASSLAYAGLTVGVSALALGVGYWLGARSVDPTPPTLDTATVADDSITVTEVNSPTHATPSPALASARKHKPKRHHPKHSPASAASTLDTIGGELRSAISKQPIIFDATTRFNRKSIRTETKDAVEPEIDGDVFDRARVMVGFNQSVMESQVALVLGVGGVGSTVCFALARLGIKKMFILDRDTVDASNLNRQMLFGVGDVGKRKVGAALETLLSYHNLRTEIVPMDMDAVTNWDKVVAAAAECTVIFNNIDYGACFDLAVSALAKQLHIPYLAASTYAFNVELTLCKGGVSDSCFTCMQSIADSFGHWDVSDLTAWATKELGSPTALFDARAISAYLTGPARKMVPPDTAFLAEVLAAANRPAGVTAAEFPKVFAGAWRKAVVARLVPSRIRSFASINFIPRDPAYPTRTVGSWVCVCVGGSLLLVNKWVQHVMRPYQSGVQPVRTWTKFNLGMEGGGYDLDSSLNQQDLKFCDLCKDMPPPPAPTATAASTGTTTATATATTTAAASAATVPASATGASAGDQKVNSK